jgi:signal transduction histidine kinase
VTVSQRLYLAVMPAIIGVFAVAALAYWGQYDRQAPHVLVIVGVIASVGSLIVAWRNTRYVASRVTRLAAPSQVARDDELDAIEHEVDRLRRAVAGAEADQAGAQQRADAAVQEYGALVADAAMAAARQLDEIRMPLHILLENRFGDLNDNQEEMLAAARTAADDAQASLERLRQVADADRGTLRLRTERVRLTDLVTALLPGLSAEGAHGSVTVSADLSPWVPAVLGDRARLGQALSLLAIDAVRRTPSGGAVRITAGASDPAARSAPGPQPRPAAGTPGTPLPMVRLVISHGTLPGRMTDIALADRLITALGGRVQHSDDQTMISVPAAPDGPVPAYGSKAASAAVPSPTPTPTTAAGRGSITK